MVKHVYTYMPNEFQLNETVFCSQSSILTNVYWWEHMVQLDLWTIGFKAQDTYRRHCGELTLFSQQMGGPAKVSTIPASHL